MFGIKFEKHWDLGILIIRLVVGSMFIIRGWAKVTGGVERWEGLGGAVGKFGISFAPAFWGFMASISEFGGGILLTLGLFHRVACIFMFVTMLVASVNHFANGDTVGRAAHAMEAGATFAGLFLLGPGKYSIDGWWRNRKMRSAV